YELLTGRVPFEGHQLTEIVTAVVDGNPPPPSTLVPGLPPALEAAILACLERELDRRSASVAELGASLAPLAPPAAARSLDILGGEAPQREQGPRSVAALRVVGVAAALLIGGVLAFLLLRLR